MSQRLEQLTDESLEQGGRRAQHTLDESGFSDALKKRLEERIEASRFRSDHAAAFAEVDMPESAGRGTRDLAAAPAWSGTESTEDSALRMLVDSHPPAKGTRSSTASTPSPRPVLNVQASSKRSSGLRLANARDRSSIYALAKDASLSDKEREQMRRDLKERFAPGARPMPTTVQGLASLANERIEHAIARGQFKNLPRGKQIERDYNASSPFLDTTEYFMNKIIQKQEIVPPWIEKQQELVRAANVFRGRLRADWKRHAARTIASRGGTLRDQMHKAEAYAVAERLLSPKSHDPAATTTTMITAVPDAVAEPTSTIPSASTSTSTSPHTPHPPFRDPTWETTERSYHTLAINELNKLTRSYNLMAPELAKKPYFSLERELRACFADVAPHLALEIRERARAPAPPRLAVDERIGHRLGGMLDRFAGDKKVPIYESPRPHYGLKELWRDFWR
ncbi:MAG: hypothetical protein M1838_002317 [Thelocarpon superellum]|nr:MAG: hypothetical protein M1838_002317 [Thelocarpon superellum]